MAKKALEGNYKVTRDKIAKKFKICESQNKCNYSNLLVEIKNDRIDEQVISFISCALNEVCKKMDKQKTHEFSWSIWQTVSVVSQRIARQSLLCSIRDRFSQEISFLAMYMCSIWPHIGLLFSLWIHPKSECGIWIYTINITICHIQIWVVSTKRPVK